MDQTDILHIKNRINKLKPTTGGLFLYYFLPYRKKVILKNLDLIFGDNLNIEEKKKFVKLNYSHFTKFLYELIIDLPKCPTQYLHEIDVNGKENAIKAKDESPGGMIFLCGHIGNFERGLLGGAQTIAQHDAKPYCIRKKLGVKKIEKFVFNRLKKAKLDVILTKGALKKSSELLKDNKNIIFFVIDQHMCISKKNGIKANFLGKPCGTYTSIAHFAKQGYPIVPVQSYRDENGKTCSKIYPALEWIAHEDPEKEIELNTQQYNDCVGKFVLEYPEQWIWLHRRWKLKEAYEN